MKTCEHKGCTKQFVAAGRRRYCDDHFIGRNHQATYERNQKKAKINQPPRDTKIKQLKKTIKVSSVCPSSITFSGTLTITHDNKKVHISGDNITISI